MRRTRFQLVSAGGRNGARRHGAVIPSSALRTSPAVLVFVYEDLVSRELDASNAKA